VAWEKAFNDFGLVTKFHVPEIQLLNRFYQNHDLIRRRAPHGPMVSEWCRIHKKKSRANALPFATLIKGAFY
jgi:hypothetical protein